jgi:hypothetical protein
MSDIKATTFRLESVTQAFFKGLKDLTNLSLGGHLGTAWGCTSCGGGFAGWTRWCWWSDGCAGWTCARCWGSWNDRSAGWTCARYRSSWSDGCAGWTCARYRSSGGALISTGCIDTASCWIFRFKFNFFYRYTDSLFHLYGFLGSLDL